MRPGPAGWHLRQLRGRIYFDSGRFSDALADIATSVELRPDETLNFGWIFPPDFATCPDATFRAGILSLADKIVERTNGSAAAYNVRGRLHAVMRNFDAARADFESAVAAPVHDNGQRGRRAVAVGINGLAWFLSTTEHAESREPSRAVELAEHAVASTPNEGFIWNTLGVARYRTGDWAGARVALEKAIELRSGGDYIEWLFLAMTFWQLGNKDEARTWYDRAVEWIEHNKLDDGKSLTKGFSLAEGANTGELQRFRAEAAALLGVPETSARRPAEEAQPAASLEARPPAVPLPED